MDDLISRQAAIEVADAVWSVTGDKNVAKVWDQIKDLPSAQPERKRGRWIVLGEQIENQTFDECKCSECECIEYFNKGWKHFNYCPNCGAQMEGR